MGIPEPTSRLWSAVKAVHDSWPPDDESVAHVLAGAWRSGGDLIDREVKSTDAAGTRILVTWGDDGGTAFHGRVAQYVQTAGHTQGRTQVHAAQSGHYAAELAATKNTITATIAANETTYALLGNPLLGPAGAALQTAFATAIAAHLQGVVADKAAALLAHPLGPPPPASPPPGDPESYGLDDLLADGLRWWGGVDQSVWNVVGDRAQEVYEGVGDVVGGALNAAGDLTGIDELSQTGDEVRAHLDAEGVRTSEWAQGIGTGDSIDLHHLAADVDGDKEPATIYVSRENYPESAAHIDAAQNGTSYRGAASTAYARTQDRELTIDRDGAKDNRRESLRGIPSARPEYDRDEYPPAMFEEGGEGASVKYIPPKDNQGSGASIGNQARKLADGDTVIIETR